MKSCHIHHRQFLHPPPEVTLAYIFEFLHFFCLLPDSCLVLIHTCYFCVVFCSSCAVYSKTYIRRPVLLFSYQWLFLKGRIYIHINLAKEFKEDFSINRQYDFYCHWLCIIYSKCRTFRMKMRQSVKIRLCIPRYKYSTNTSRSMFAVCALLYVLLVHCKLTPSFFNGNMFV